jgi:hypothetical protein
MRLVSEEAVRPIRAARTRVELAASFIVLGVELCSFGWRCAALSDFSSAFTRGDESSGAERKRGMYISIE